MSTIGMCFGFTRSQRSVCDEIYKVIDKFYMGANSSDVSRYIEKRNGTK